MGSPSSSYCMKLPELMRFSVNQEPRLSLSPLIQYMLLMMPSDDEIWLLKMLSTILQRSHVSFGVLSGLVKMQICILSSMEASVVKPSTS